MGCCESSRPPYAPYGGNAHHHQGPYSQGHGYQNQSNGYVPGGVVQGKPVMGGSPGYAAYPYSTPSPCDGYQAGHHHYAQPYGQPAYGQAAYGQPAYGQPAYGQPAYGQPAYGQGGGGGNGMAMAGAGLAGLAGGFLAAELIDDIF
ncbi:unnamed protein product [Durusdinium trenchii]